MYSITVITELYNETKRITRYIKNNDPEKLLIAKVINKKNDPHKKIILKEYFSYKSQGIINYATACFNQLDKMKILAKYPIENKIVLLEKIKHKNNNSIAYHQEKKEHTDSWKKLFNSALIIRIPDLLDYFLSFLLKLRTSRAPFLFGGDRCN